jgi:hypothetical protein
MEHDRQFIRGRIGSESESEPSKTSYGKSVFKSFKMLKRVFQDTKTLVTQTTPDEQSVLNNDIVNPIPYSHYTFMSYSVINYEIKILKSDFTMSNYPAYT